MIKNHKNSRQLCFLTSLFLLSCQSSVPLDISLKDPDLSGVMSVAPHENPKQASPQTSVSLRFGLNFSQAFMTQCASCKPRYVRLRIQGSQNISEPLYAINADDNGFIEIDPDTPLQSLSAEVPEGNNWAAFASLHMNNDAESPPVARIGGVFHNPPLTTEQIELSKRALQTAEIVNAMHDLGDDRLFSALDLQRYQAMTDALLGVEQNSDGTYTLGRVPNGEILDAETLARLLNTGALNPENPETASLLPLEALLPKPQVKSSVRLQSFTAGLSKLVMNSQSKGIFAYDILQNQRRMYGFQAPGLESILTPYDLGDLRNVYLSLGQANPTGSQTLPVTYTYANEGLDRMVLRARSQTANSVVWSYAFEDIPALRSDYVPTVFRDTQETLDPSDDTDHVYVTFNADRFNHPEQRGVYAIEEGQKLWHVNINKDFNIAGALSASGDRLYVISRSNPSTPSRLYAINTSEGVANPADRLLWDISLRGATESSGGETFTTSTPVMGKNGDIYLTTFSLPPDFKLGDSLPGFLRCISPEGQERWAFPLASSSGFSPVVDHRDGQDLIYLTTDRGQVLAIDGAGVKRWDTLLPGTAGEGPVDAPLIGEDLDGGRTLYQGMGNGLIYAVKDRGSRGEILWAQAPQAKVSRGMVLKDGFLYAPTLDGGEGQTVQIKGIQVHSLGLASTAPWPITGGNLAAQHISALTQEGY